jgi:hypothetical protein
MTDKKTKPRPPRQRVPAPGNRCTHRDAARRQCRNLALGSTGSCSNRDNAGLCVPHSTEERQLSDIRLTAKHLFAKSPPLNTTAAINHVLARLFELIANNRIPMRNAALLAYVGSLLLNSVPNVKSEVFRMKGSAGLDTLIGQAFEILESDPNEESESDSASDSDEDPDSEAVPDTGLESDSDAESDPASEPDTNVPAEMVSKCE